jgi:restriction system protein
LISESTNLADWLSKVFAEGDAFDSGNESILPACYFPTEEIREEYISIIDSRPEDEVRKLIRRMLVSPGAFADDQAAFNLYLKMLRNRDESTLERDAEFWQSEHMQNVIAWYMGSSREPSSPGTRWILRLLPDRPRMALSVLEAYFIAYITHFGDLMVYALSDVEAIIRARYIGVPASTAERVQLLYDLSSREFERIVENLYAAMDFDTQLTSPSGDGGRDIIVASTVTGQRIRLLVECKRYRAKVGVEIVRALLGVVATERANKGVLVTTADFTRGARQLEGDDPRIELISGSRLVLLLNEYLGGTWPAHIEYLTREGPIGAS